MWLLIACAHKYYKNVLLSTKGLIVWLRLSCRRRADQSIQISKKAAQIKYFYSIDSSNKSNDAVRGNKETYREKHCYTYMKY